MKSIEDVMSEWNALQPLSDRDREMLSRRFTIDFERLSLYHAQSIFELRYEFGQ